MTTLSQRMRESVGMVIPVWFCEETGEERIYELLAGTLGDTELFVQPANLLLVVDGCPVAVGATRRLHGELARAWGEAPELHVLEENLGKGGVVASAFERLLARKSLRWLSIRDADGDHSIYDLPHLFRLGEQTTAEAGTDLVIVCGRRADLRRPLGLWRGEYERLVAQVVWQGLRLALAREGRGLREQYLNAYGRTPDLQSGYKLYGRAAAQVAAEGLRREAAKHPQYNLLGWGVEVVPALEVLLQGGVWAEVQRLAYETQPQSTFDQSARPREYGGKLAWAMRRLDLAPAVALSLLDSILPMSALYQEAAGRQELLRLRRFVADELGLDAGEAIPVPDFF